MSKTEKYCNGCDKTRPVAEFYRNKGRHDGLTSRCWQCHNAGVIRAYLRLRRAILEKFGGKCNRCAFSDPRALQVDHVNGGGSREVREGRQPARHLRAVLADESGKYQLLCANCNWIKRCENGELPRSEREFLEGSGGTQEEYERDYLGRRDRGLQHSRQSLDEHRGVAQAKSTAVRKQRARTGVYRTKYPLLSDEAWLRQKYLVEQLTTEQIGTIVGIEKNPRSHVAQALKRLGIPARVARPGHAAKVKAETLTTRVN